MLQFYRANPACRTRPFCYPLGVHPIHSVLAFGMLDSSVLGISDQIWIFFLFPFVLAVPILWIWALVSCLKNESSIGNTKLVWVLLILFLHVFGALLYFLIRRPERLRELGR